MPMEMEKTYTFRNINATEALKEHADKKLNKLNKYLTNQSASAHIIFKKDGSGHNAEITLHIKGKNYIVTNTSHDMYTSLDLAIHKLEMQLSKNKERTVTHKGI